MNAASADASRSSSRKARAEAAAWIVRLHGPNRTPSLEAALREWLAADAENRLQFQRVTEVWDDARGIPVGGITRVAYPSRGTLKRSWGLAALVLAACGIGLLGQFRVVLKGLGFGQEVDGFGDLRIPLGADLEAFQLSELRGEELALDALLHPIVDAGDVRIRVVDLVVL